MAVPGQSEGDILAHPDPLPPLPPAAEARRQKALARMADRPGVRYAVTVDDPGTDPVVMALAIRDKGTCEVLIPKDWYDPLAVLAMMEG